MKPRFFTLSFLFFSISLMAQDFSEVDEYARSTPSSKSTSVEKLASYLAGKFSSEHDKVRSIYIWMAENIKYSTSTVNNQRLSIEQRIKRQEPSHVLKSKRAVCEGYSNLFEALCEAAGIQSLIITGYSKLPNGKVAPNGHAWNMVRVDGKWQLMDVTWGAGGVNGANGKYVKSLSEEFFFSKPSEFIQHHLPHDPLFQLLPQAVSFDVFKTNKTIVVNNGKVDEKVHEELSVFYNLKKEERLLATSRRAVEFDSKNGFANFTLSKYHYENALSSYNGFYKNSDAVFKKKTPITTAMVDEWEAYLNEYKKELKKSEEYLTHIRSGDPISDAARQSKNAIQQAWKISKQTDRQLEEYRRYLKKAGR